uniref:Uncharacterized protein n=1 Tax=Acrobeloides nanus TaxID=290746 RepID=A0A914CS91_9BILA
MRDAYLPAEAFIGYHSITDFDELCEVIRLCRGKWFDPPWLDMVFPNKSRIGRTIKNLKDTSNNYLPSFWPHANALRNYVWCQLPKCGQAQNSMFFDTFDVVGEDGIVPMTEDDINHAKERIAYKNPPNQHTVTIFNHFDFNKSASLEENQRA